MRRIGTSGAVAAVALAMTALAAPGAPQTVTPATSFHVVAARHAVTDASGLTWQPDAAYATGGSLSTSARNVARTASPALYRAQRSGVTSYAFPVSSAGTYAVVLYLVEAGGRSAGQRVYDVTAEGATVAAGVDVARDAGPDAAWHVLATVPVTDGTLNLSLAPRVGQPAVSAVAVTLVKRALATATTFDDEFDGVGSDHAWVPDVRPGYNNELEYDTAHNASVVDGSLVIEARRGTYAGPYGQSRGYTSASLSTTGHFTWTFGHAEASIWCPPGAGLWPTFWATGTVPNSWPREGEIDAMELKGQEPSVDYGTVHGATTSGAHWHYGATTTVAAPLTGSWHVYGMTWLPGAIATSVDGSTYMTVTPADLPKDDVWPFTASDPHVLRLDLAVGGRFGGTPAATAFPARMKVDWVRVTQ